jgi:GNAT superfamily N-acetyltransferase
MQIVGPQLEARAQCEQVLRSLPKWFGIEHALVMYVDDTARLPTFAAMEGDRLVGFISLMKHFEDAWEVHCMAVHADFRNAGHGSALLVHAEAWLAAQGVSLLQVKTVAATSASVAYAQTREFYKARGFRPLQVFPDLWDARNPALQLIKVLPGE